MLQRQLSTIKSSHEEKKEEEEIEPRRSKGNELRNHLEMISTCVWLEEILKLSRRNSLSLTNRYEKR